VQNDSDRPKVLQIGVASGFDRNDIDWEVSGDALRLRTRREELRIREPFDRDVDVRVPPEVPPSQRPGHHDPSRTEGISKEIANFFANLPRHGTSRPGRRFILGPLALPAIDVRSEFGHFGGQYHLGRPGAKRVLPLVEVCANPPAHATTAPMSRRANAAFRCERCHLHDSLCVCALIPRIETRTCVVLVIHRYEDRKPTNTGRLATECLTNSEVLVRGHETRPSLPFTAASDSQPLVLFPYPGARPLTDYANSSRAITLVVPDGNWRQASKVYKRVPGLRDVDCVSLPPGPPSRYRLRAEAHEKGLSTLEAIARALGILEGATVQQALEQIFSAMVTRTLWARGEIGTRDVTGGIPEGAKRHDPTSGLWCSRSG
jgi:DTW domain-containing protein YfiP